MHIFMIRTNISHKSYSGATTPQVDMKNATGNRLVAFPSVMYGFVLFALFYLVPFFTGKNLHVGSGVEFVHNLYAEHRFNNIFHCYDAS